MATETAASKASSSTAGSKFESVDAPAPRSAGRRDLILIAATAVLASASLGGGAYFALRPSRDAEHQAAPKAEKETGKDKKDAPKERKDTKPAQFVNLEMFTVNLRADASGEHYLQLGLIYEVAGSDTSDALKAGMPVIRSRILLTLTGKTALELQTTEGKTRLAEELLGIARAALPGGAPDKGVAAAHFSAFVIQ